eukprot:s504_g16.t1
MGDAGPISVAFPAGFQVQDGRCRLAEYETTKTVNVKMRWRGRPLAEVMLEEFGLTAEYVRALEGTTVPLGSLAAGIATKGCGAQDSVVLQLYQLRKLPCVAYAYAEWGPLP